jgi:hypothetical protein
MATIFISNSSFIKFLGVVQEFEINLNNTFYFFSHRSQSQRWKWRPLWKPDLRLHGGDNDDILDDAAVHRLEFPMLGDFLLRRFPIGRG